ncbi:hypothetical protein AGMMS49957_03150 [Synergistales bacterium]|nr:hypothetical protein AGMMS49957_03150 [Synergistales bacterium]
MPNTISGVVSGVDWEGLISDALEAARGPAYIQAAKRDKLELKKSLLEELRVDFQALQSALTPIKLASTFKMKQVNIDRIDSSGSYKGVLTATVNADAAINVYDLEVLQIAKSQISRSDQFVGGSVSTTGTGSYFYVNAGGQKLRVDLPSGTNSLASVAEAINTKLKTARPPVAVTASVVDSRIVLKSDNVGSGETVLTSNLKRSANSSDLIQFPLDASNYDGGMYTIDTLDSGNGKLEIKSGSTTYTQGVDFDVLSGGRIRWRETVNPYVTANNPYKITYKLAENETYSVTGARSSGNTDKGVLNFTADTSGTIKNPPIAEPDPTDTTLYPGGSADAQYILDLDAYRSDPSNRITITVGNGSGALTYKYGTDFTISGNDIVWKNASTLLEGVTYKVNYIGTGAAGATETLTIDMNRSVPPVGFNLALVTGGTTGTPAPALYADFADGTATITSASTRIYRQGVDFDIVPDGAQAQIRWREDSLYIAPAPGEEYTLSLTKADGTDFTSGALTMASVDNVNLANFDIGAATTGGVLTGTLAVSGYAPYDPAATSANGNYVITVPNATNNTTFSIDWARIAAATPPATPPPFGMAASTPRNTPAYGADYTVTYTYNTNEFSFSDDGNGTLAALGLGKTDADHYSAGQDAILMLDGEKITRSSNVISADNKNELIKGMTIELKGIGRVSLDVEQDAEAAVTAMQGLVTAYNDIISWINIRSTEKELDETTKSTVDSDDFRMKWGLLRGSSVLRNTKESMRRLMSQIYSPAFTTKTSRKGVYGDLGLNGLVADRTITISNGGDRVLSLFVSPADTLKDVMERINYRTTDSGRPNPLNDYNEDDPSKTVFHVKATVENGQLTLTANSGSATIGGSVEALSAMSINYSYNTLSQIGVKMASSGTMSSDANAGMLDFDTSAFMEALTNNAADVADLMTTFAAQMQTYVDNTIKMSQSEIGAGVVAVQGSLAREMNALDDEMARIDKYLSEFSAKQTEKERKLRAQYATSETTLAKYMEQANWLSGVVSQLQGQQAS